MSPYGDLTQRKLDYWRTNEVKNLEKIANPQAFTVEYVLSYFSFNFSHYIVLEAKCVRNWKSGTHWRAHYPVRETKLPNFAFISPAYWIWEPLLPLISPNARLPTKRSGPNILAQLSAEKQWVGGWGVCITLAPHYQYWLSINRSLWQFGLKSQSLCSKEHKHTSKDKAWPSYVNVQFICCCPVLHRLLHFYVNLSSGKLTHCSALWCIKGTVQPD